MDVSSIKITFVPRDFCNSKGPSPIKLWMLRAILSPCEQIINANTPLLNRCRLLHNQFLMRCYPTLSQCYVTAICIIHYICRCLLRVSRPHEKAYQAYVVNKMVSHLLDNHKAVDVYRAITEEKEVRAQIGAKVSFAFLNADDAELALRSELNKRLAQRYLNEVSVPDPLPMLLMAYNGFTNLSKKIDPILRQYAEKMKGIDAYATSMIVQQMGVWDGSGDIVKEAAKKQAQVFKIYANEHMAALRPFCAQIRGQLSPIGLEVGEIPSLIMQYADEGMLERAFIYIRRTEYQDARKNKDLTIHNPLMVKLAEIYIDHPDYRDFSKAKELLKYLPEDRHGALIQAMQAYPAQDQPIASETFGALEQHFTGYQKKYYIGEYRIQELIDIIIAALQQLDEQRQQEVATS